ncbi:hypothetical protein [Streptomyces sp. NPDC047046]|uniref:hypothetical protein n=1 Tax=Streptomyces sp. NPDC047046 TaxID=3155378 RepID=UPI0033C29F8B
MRIAEPAGLRLVRPGDRVDVIAVSGTGPRTARVVVAGARVVALPRPPGSAPSPSGETTASLPTPSPASAGAGAEVWPEADAETRWDATDSGSVIVLTVPRASAVDLAAASATSALAVVAC